MLQVIKKFAFYACSTTKGTGMLQVHVASAMFFRLKSKQNGEIRAMRQFRTLVDSGIDVDHTEKRKLEFCSSITG